MSSGLYSKNTHYGASPHLIDEVNKRKNIQIYSLIASGILLICAILLENMCKDLRYDKSQLEMLSMLKWLSLIWGISDLLIAPFVLFNIFKTQSKLNQTHITVYSDRISGVYFNNPVSDEGGISFEVGFDEIISASPVGDTTLKENNIKIQTTSRTYYCFAIDRRSSAIELINEKAKDFAAIKSLTDSAHTPKPQSKIINTFAKREGIEISNENTIFCMYCGTKLAADAVFCSKCGKTLPKF